jgi:hypothetical protein
MSQKPELVLTKDNYITYLKHSKPGEMYYYERRDSFNIKFIQAKMKEDYGIDVKYNGEYLEYKAIYTLLVLAVPDFTLPDEIVEQKTIFFDPVNLTA